MSQTTATQRGIDQASDKTAIYPFHVSVPETELTELRRRINATKWPERETVRMRRKAYSSPRYRRWPAIGRQNTTGARSRRN